MTALDRPYQAWYPTKQEAKREAAARQRLIAELREKINEDGPIAQAVSIEVAKWARERIEAAIEKGDIELDIKQVVFPSSTLVRIAAATLLLSLLDDLGEGPAGRGAPL